MKQPIQNNEIPAEIVHFAGSIQDLTFPRQGHTSDVAILTAGNGTFCVKRTKGKRFSEWLRQEAFILKRLEKSSLPIPKIFLFHEKGEEAWTLTQFMEGETMRSFLWNEKDAAKREEAIFNFGKTLANIHAAPVPPELETGEPWLEIVLKQAEYNLTHYQVDGTPELLERIKKNKPEPVRQTFIHGDFTIDNVLVKKDGQIAAIIDWSSGAHGDPRYDAALAIRPKPNAFQEQKEIAIFFEGYGRKIINAEEYAYFEDGIYNFF